MTRDIEYEEAVQQIPALILARKRVSNAEMEELKRKITEQLDTRRTMFLSTGTEVLTRKGPMKFIADADIENMVRHHPPTSDEVIKAHERVRSEFADLMVSMNNLLPEGPDKTRTIVTLREGMMWANSCIAIAQDVYRDMPQLKVCGECLNPIEKAIAPGSKWVHVYDDSETPNHPAAPAV